MNIFLLIALTVLPETYADQELRECMKEIENNEVCCVWIDSEQQILIKDSDDTFRSLEIDSSIKRAICDETKGTITL